MNIQPQLYKHVEDHPYPLLFVTISGAHLYGFPSPDSDFDLRGAHLLPLEDVLGLKPGEETVEKSGIHDGLEIDLVTHDVKKFFGLMLKKNGYVMEQVLSPLVVHTTQGGWRAKRAVHILSEIIREFGRAHVRDGKAHTKKHRKEFLFCPKKTQ